MVEVYKSGLIEKQFHEQGEAEALEALILDFEDYKRTGDVPRHFGRDVPYDHPSTPPTVRFEQVKHLHLVDGANPSLHTVQFRRTSDVHLVYCQGAMNDDCYLLITILTPDGHAKARDRNIMSNIGMIAEKFREEK